MRATLLIAAASTDDVEPWTGTEVAVRFGLPTLVVLIGMVVFLGGRSERASIRAEVAERGGFGGPPGTSDVGSPEGFRAEESAEQIRAATGKVLIGLLLMLLGSLSLLGVTFWRIFS